jgi:hypothetical protein
LSRDRKATEKPVLLSDEPNHNAERTGKYQVLMRGAARCGGGRESWIVDEAGKQKAGIVLVAGKTLT